MKPSIIIADDHPLILKGLHDFLTEKKYNVIAIAANGKDAYELIVKHSPDIAILDIRMPFMSGIEVTKKCMSNNINTKIVLITFEKSIQLYQEAKALTVSGYILKEFALIEIENCLISIQNNTPYFSPEIEEYISKQKDVLGFSFLTPTEKKILKLIAQNKTAKEIGGVLFTSNRTVEKHKSNIIKKLNIQPHQNSLLIWAKENQDSLL
ncbi:MAG: response regulator transcription factor [Flavobacteriaceae bacterium]|nr:response regulator transcription factor [Flavobacteriaceae bacterium]